MGLDREVPSGMVAGGGSFVLTLQGDLMTVGASITFRGSALSATRVSDTELTASIPSSLVSTAPTGNYLVVTVTNPGPGGGTSVPLEFGVASNAVNYNVDVQGVFDNNCSGSGCHFGNQNPNLSSGQSRNNLVNVQSEGCPDKVRVTPGIPTRDKSFLADKLLSTAISPPCSGTSMPKGKPLNAIEKQKIIDWIASGAGT